MVKLEPELANVKCSCTETQPLPIDQCSITNEYHKTSLQNDQDYQAYPAWGEV